MIVIETIGQHIEHGYTITAHCEDCRRYSVLPLEPLGAKLGMDHSAMANHLVPKLKCGRCGSKRLGLILSPPTHVPNENPYLKAKGQ